MSHSPGDYCLGGCGRNTWRPSGYCPTCKPYIPDKSPRTPAERNALVCKAKSDVNLHKYLQTIDDDPDAYGKANRYGDE